MSHKEYLYAKVKELRKKAITQGLKVKKHAETFNKSGLIKKHGFPVFRDFPLIDCIFLALFKDNIDENTKTCEILLPDMGGAIKFFDLALKYSGFCNLDKFKELKFTFNDYDCYYNREGVKSGVDYIIAIGDSFKKIGALYKNSKSPLSIYSSFDVLEKVLKK